MMEYLLKSFTLLNILCFIFKNILNIFILLKYHLLCVWFDSFVRLQTTKIFSRYKRSPKLSWPSFPSHHLFNNGRSTFRFFSWHNIVYIYFYFIISYQLYKKEILIKNDLPFASIACVEIRELNIFIIFWQLTNYLIITLYLIILTVEIK